MLDNYRKQCLTKQSLSVKAEQNLGNLEPWMRNEKTSYKTNGTKVTKKVRVSSFFRSKNIAEKSDHIVKSVPDKKGFWFGMCKDFKHFGDLHERPKGFIYDR